MLKFFEERVTLFGGVFTLVSTLLTINKDSRVVGAFCMISTLFALVYIIVKRSENRTPEEYRVQKESVEMDILDWAGSVSVLTRTFELISRRNGFQDLKFAFVNDDEISEFECDGGSVIESVKEEGRYRCHYRIDSPVQKGEIVFFSLSCKFKNAFILEENVFSFERNYKGAFPQIKIVFPRGRYFEDLRIMKRLGNHEEIGGFQYKKTVSNGREALHIDTKGLKFKETILVRWKWKSVK